MSVETSDDFVQGVLPCTGCYVHNYSRCKSTRRLPQTITRLSLALHGIDTTPLPLIEFLLGRRGDAGLTGHEAQLI